MGTTTVDLPELLNRYVESEVQVGRYQSADEAIREMVRKEIKREHGVDEPLSEETLEAIENARTQTDDEFASVSNATVRPQFKDDVQRLPDSVTEAVADTIDALATDYVADPWHHPHVDYLPSNGGVWRLEVDRRDHSVNHRVFFDIDGNDLVFLTVKHRAEAYGWA